MRIFSAILTLVVLAGTAHAEEPAIDRAALKTRIETLLRDTKTATWYQDGWFTNGKEEEVNVADCFWRAPDHVRLNVKKGRGSGATAVYKNGKVMGFKPGMFSFVKLTYDVRDKEVLGVRGQDIRTNGFFDDLGLILKQWDSVVVANEGAKLRIAYKNLEGLATEMWVDAATLHPSRIESKDNDKVVEKQTYAKVVLNPTIDEKVFNP